MTIPDLLVIGVLIALIAGMLYSLARATTAWKPMLIALVLVLCGLMLWWPGRYGPDTRLKPGLDLAGGTTLLYDVRVPADANADQIISDLISVLRERVDPTGTMNLVWRQVAGNRIEIQMPLATARTADLRRAFGEARDELLAGNLTRQQVEAALRAEGDQQAALFDQIANGNQQLLDQLQGLAEAHERLVSATTAYQQAQQQHRAAQRQLDQAPEETDAEQQQRDQLQQEVETLLNDLIAQAEAYNEAQQAYDQQLQRVLGSNIDPQRLEVTLNLSDQAPAGGQPSPREEAIEQLKQDYPGRAGQIDAVAQAYGAYEQVRGPLDDPNDLIELLRGAGVLEFRIAATPGSPIDIAGFREQLEERGPRAGSSQAWRWYAIDDIDQFTDSERDLQALEADPAGYFASRGYVGAEYTGQYYLLLANTPDRAITRDQDRWELTGVSIIRDQYGRSAASFQLNEVGGQRMRQITGPNVQQPMAILLDNSVISAPTLQSEIGSRGQITGDFSPQELDYLVRTLEAGSSEAELGDYPISIQTTGPQLGEDNLRAGLQAAVWSLIVVMLFMVVYYFFAGMVADFALVANMVIILGVMAMINATFTLPGIAGLVLTIGMAVDANVLIFERIREEQERGANLETSLRLGFDKALSTILDANLTTLITCFVLYYVATADIKGFALVLGIGIVATLFTSLFCSRVFLDLWHRRGKARQLTMLPTLIPAVRRLLSPNVDWIGKRYAFFGISAALMIAGLVMIIGRGQDIFDIEFRSGTQVSFELAEGEQLTIETVRQRLDDYAYIGTQMQQPGFDPAQLSAQEREIHEDLRGILSASEARGAGDEPVRMGWLSRDQASVVTLGETERTPQGTAASSFSVATLITDSQVVSSVVKAAFEDSLETSRPVSFAGATQPIEQAAGQYVYPVESASLGEVIGRQGVTEDVSEYLGGAAIVIDQMNPALTEEELAERIRRTRLLPEYEALGYRPFEVVGLELAEGDGDQPRYSSFAVVVREPGTDYTQTPGQLTDPQGLAGTEWGLVTDALQRDTSLASVSNFSGSVSKTMRDQAIIAMALSLLAVVAYIWFRFGSIRYGLAAIAALVHDVTIALGILALTGFIADESFIAQALLLDPFKINLAVVAALLTIVGYSLNDTIIIFDRIRENRGRLARATPAIINDSINQTISRTIITSSTTLLALLVLYLFGGQGIHGFAFMMLVGVLVGTYSSIALASPLLLIGYHKGAEMTDAAGQTQPADAAPAAGK